MFRKNASSYIDSYKYQLAMCQNQCEGYTVMKYYIAVFLYDVNKDRDATQGYNEGFFVRNDRASKWDYFDLEDFNHYFMIVDNCETDKKIDNALYWLRTVRKINIKIIPVILEDGYWYEYRFVICYPFNVYNEEGSGMDNFILAAKEAIKKAKKACLEAHGKKGASHWLEYILKGGQR